MSRSVRRLLWALAIAVPLFFLIIYLAIHTVSAELEERFYQSFDSVPTRVYSSVYWLKPGTGASLEELRFRLKERDYRDVGRPEQVQGPGTYALETDGARPLALTLYSNEFNYPALAKEMIFGNPEAAITPTRYTVLFTGGEVTKVQDNTGGDAPGLALEPTLVAQLNEGSVQARRTVSLSQIPHTLMKGIVLIEDTRFLEHPGIDIRGIVRSMYVNLRSGGYVQGASTITQQLARNVYLSRQKTITRKLKEMAMSVLLEFKFSKDQILEKYLNEVYFGQSGNIAVHGVSEAAKFYYNKNLDELTIAEQAMLAGVVRGPFYYSPFRHYERAKGRQEIVLAKMYEAGVIAESQYKQAKNERIKFARISLVQNRAPYFTDMVQAQLLKDLPEQEVLGAGFTIFSTLDTFYQAQAEKAVANGVANLEKRMKAILAKKPKPKAKKGPAPEAAPLPEPEQRMMQGVFVAVDPASGHLLALVGGRSYEESTYNRALLMRRQIGSLIKPFVYLSALIYGRNPDGTPINSISKFEDKPFVYEFDKQSWSPRNYEDGFAGIVTLRYALANSINTVAAQVAIATGLDKLVSVAKSAGIETNLRALPSLALGAVELPPMEVATAYTTLANFGLKRELTSTLAVVGEDGRSVARYQSREERALPPEETSNIVQLMTSVLDIGSARGARAAGFFWPAAGKTGTTNEFRDAWFAGFTKKMVGIAWVGFDHDDDVVRSSRKALKLSGATGALPVWTDFMMAAHRNQEFQALPYPDGMLRTLEVDLISGKRANHRCMGDGVMEETFTYRNVPSEECN